MPFKTKYRKETFRMRIIKGNSLNVCLMLVNGVLKVDVYGGRKERSS